MAGEFKDGIKHGLWQTLNQIGDPIMIGHFDNGKKHGDFEQWYDDGASRHRELIATFDQDKYVGKYREWYENGKRSIWGFYIDGKESKEDTLSGMKMGKKHSKQSLSMESLMDGIENGKWLSPKKSAWI